MISAVGIRFVDGDGCDLQDPTLYATAPVPHQVREQPVLPG